MDTDTKVTESVSSPLEYRLRKTVNRLNFMNVSLYHCIFVIIYLLTSFTKDKKIW